jgi:hypothetical protein
VWKKGTCPLRLGKEGTKHILLEYPETKNWRPEMLCKRWFCTNEEGTYKTMLGCTNKMTVKIWEHFYSEFNVNGKG